MSSAAAATAPSPTRWSRTTPGRYGQQRRALDFRDRRRTGSSAIETAGGQEAATGTAASRWTRRLPGTATGGYVMGENGRVEVGTGTVTIDAGGVVYSDGRAVDTLAILMPQQ